MRLEFAQWMTNNIDSADTVRFTDESHFYLNSPINKKKRGKKDLSTGMRNHYSSADVIGPFFLS